MSVLLAKMAVRAPEGNHTVIVLIPFSGLYAKVSHVLDITQALESPAATETEIVVP